MDKPIWFASMKHGRTSCCSGWSGLCQHDPDKLNGTAAVVVQLLVTMGGRSRPETFFHVLRIRSLKGIFRTAVRRHA